MLSERHADAVVVWAPAKVNLYLEVLAKRADGYHDLATLMVAVSLFDTLEFKEEASGEILLRCDHPTLPTGPDNLVTRAAALLRQRTGCPRGARVRLVKRIPLAAGLAGGSADAAATLAGLNRLWRLGLADAELAALAADLGSDVPFFFAGGAASCTGPREPVPAARPPRPPLGSPPRAPPSARAPAAVSRRGAARGRPETSAGRRGALARGDVDEVGRRLHNRLQPAALALRPELAEYLARLAALCPAGQA